MLLSKAQRTADWEAGRAKRITGSIAAACLGLCPYTSPKKAWRVITGREKIEDNEHMQRGRRREPIIISCYECETGELVSPTGFWVSDTHPHIGASPDGLVGDTGIVEVKCPQNLPDKCPEHYRIQVIVELFCTGREWCDWYSRTEYGESYLERITCQETEMMALVHQLDLFWHKYVDTDKEPPRRS